MRGNIMCWHEEYEYYIEEDESYSTMDSIFNDIKKTFYEKLKSDVKQKIKELEDNNKWLNTRVNELNQELVIKLNTYGFTVKEAIDLINQNPTFVYTKNPEIIINVIPTPRYFLAPLTLSNHSLPIYSV